MEISFSKIKQSPIDINYSKNGVEIVGTIICNRCGKDYKISANYPLTLILSEGGYNGKDEIDVVEFYNNKIDFDYLAQSEVSSIQEDYNYCINCKDSDEVLEIEF